MLPISSHLLLLAALFSSAASNCVQLRPLKLSEEVVSAVRPLCQVPKVSNASSCAELCLRESRCAAVRFRSASRQCDLLTARIDGLEGKAALASVNGDVEVFAIDGRGFGKCPSSYTLSWRASRYRRGKDKMRWADSQALCRSEGGKLAEVTTKEELGFFRVLEGGPLSLIGALRRGNAWNWYYSGLPIEDDMRTDAMKSKNEYWNTLTLWFTRNIGPQFRTVDVQYTQYAYLCECHQLS